MENVKKCMNKKIIIKIVVFLSAVFLVATCATAEKTEMKNAQENRNPFREAAGYFYYCAGYISELHGVLEDSVEYYKAGLKYAYDKETLYNKISEIYSDAGDTSNAVFAIEEGLKNSPDDNKLLKSAARIYMISKEYKKAQETYEKIIKTEPEYSEAYFYLGTTAFQEGNM